MKLKIDTINERLKVIDEQLTFLNSYKNMKSEDFVTDLMKTNSAKYALLVIIESCIDIGNHIITFKRWNNIDTYSDIFEVLGKNGFMKVELSQNLIKMVRFRNLLTHRYTTIDDERVLLIIQTQLDDVKSFVKNTIQFLKQQQ